MSSDSTKHHNMNQIAQLQFYCDRKSDFIFQFSIKDFRALIFLRIPITTRKHVTPHVAKFYRQMIFPAKNSNKKSFSSILPLNVSNLDCKGAETPKKQYFDFRAQNHHFSSLRVFVSQQLSLSEFSSSESIVIVPHKVPVLLNRH